MRALELLKNHPWNMQALVSDHGERHSTPAERFVVRVSPIKGFGIPAETKHATAEAALAHARTVLGMND